MAYLNDDVLDNGLSEISDDGNRIDICSQEPATYTEATSTYTLGNKTSPSIAAPANRTGGGRQVTISAFSDGSVTATDTATHEAVSDTTGSRLLATDSLSSSQSVTSGNTFSLTEFEIGIPDPA